ncbi:hypothetical protein EI94DRAFT_1092925 [Lactarius quietus]|nr:hypothetical protein EI94DRAFT_1092925 [Lactarius quietus]
MPNTDARERPEICRRRVAHLDDNTKQQVAWPHNRRNFRSVSSRRLRVCIQFRTRLHLRFVSSLRQFVDPRPYHVNPPAGFASSCGPYSKPPLHSAVHTVTQNFPGMERQFALRPPFTPIYLRTLHIAAHHDTRSGKSTTRRPSNVIPPQRSLIALPCHDVLLSHQSLR